MKGSMEYKYVLQMNAIGLRNNQFYSITFLIREGFKTKMCVGFF